MTNDDTVRAITLLLWIVLVASALASRRLPLRQTFRLGLIWVAIFGTLFVIAAYRDEFGSAWQRVRLALNPQAGTVQGGEFHIPMDEDGHFRVRASLNGREASFLIDSGATTTAISRATAKRAGIVVDESGFGVAINTANGTILARRLTILRLQVGPIMRDDFHAITASEFGDTNVLGMNFLSSLRGWGVEGRTLVLKP
jgi:aspartyl protease family protein